MNLNNQKVRLSSLDSIKFFAAFMVVYIHYGTVETGSYHVISHLIEGLCRLAVPLFFMISGYFYPILSKHGNFRRHLLKLLFLAVGSSVLYNFVHCIELLQGGGSIFEYLSTTFTPKVIVAFFIINADPSSFHLWFLWASLYVYIIFFFVDKIKKVNSLYILSCLLYIVSIPVLYSKGYVTNFLFLGLPYMCLGRYIKEKKVFLSKFSDKTFLFFVILSLILIVIECYVLGHFKMDGLDSHLFVLPAVFCLFSLALRNPSFGNGIISTIGRQDSGFIYIFHVLVARNILSSIFPHQSLIGEILYPVTIFLVTIAVIRVIRSLFKKILFKKAI